MLHRRELMWGAAAGGALAVTGAVRGALAAPAPYGRFIGGVTASWDADGRHMRLLQPFGYIDPTGGEWKVPSGATVDGASIPRAVWSLIGGPFEGRYRYPSVVHDWYCDVRTRPWREVHRMFLNGMLAAGVDETQARIMYYAVYAGGPRWNDQAIANNKLAVEQKVAELARDPAPSELTVCGGLGESCGVIYASPGATAAPAAAHHGGNWLGRMMMSVLPRAAAPPPAPPAPTRYEMVGLEGGGVAPPVTDPDQLLTLARRLADSGADLAEAEQMIERSRTAR